MVQHLPACDYLKWSNNRQLSNSCFYQVSLKRHRSILGLIFRSSLIDDIRNSYTSIIDHSETRTHYLLGYIKCSVQTIYFSQLWALIVYFFILSVGLWVCVCMCACLWECACKNYCCPNISDLILLCVDWCLLSWKEEIPANGMRKINRKTIDMYRNNIHIYLARRLFCEDLGRLDLVCLSFYHF